MHTKAILILAAAAACAAPAEARAVLTVHGLGGANAAVDGGRVTRITVARNDVTLWEGETPYMAFAMGSEVVRLTFDEQSGVNSVKAPDNGVGVRGPVTETLAFYGVDGSEAAHLKIYSAAGALCRSIAGWHGQDVDVADLQPGVYIANFNNRSIKFVKQ